MRRRRLLLLTIVLVLAGGGLGWQLFTSLNAEERWLVGNWEKDDSFVTVEYAADQTYTLTMPATAKVTGVWSLRNGTVTIDEEPSRLRRLLRAVPSLGLKAGFIGRFNIRVIGENQFEVIESNGVRRVWTRVVKK